MNILIESRRYLGVACGATARLLHLRILVRIRWCQYISAYTFTAYLDTIMHIKYPVVAFAMRYLTRLSVFFQCDGAYLLRNESGAVGVLQPASGNVCVPQHRPAGYPVAPAAAVSGQRDDVCSQGAGEAARRNLSLGGEPNSVWFRRQATATYNALNNAWKSSQGGRCMKEPGLFSAQGDSSQVPTYLAFSFVFECPDLFHLAVRRWRASGSVWIAAMRFRTAALCTRMWTCYWPS